MTTSQKLWEQIFWRFDPASSTLPAWRVSRPYSPSAAISAALRSPFAMTKRYLFMGTTGTGKTTELMAIAEKATRDHLVIFLDIARHVREQVGQESALQHLQAWEVLLLIGLAIYGRASTRFGHKWHPEHADPFIHAVERLTASSSPGKGPTLDVTRLANAVVSFAGGALGLDGAELSLLTSSTAAAKWDLPLGLRGRASIPDQDARVQDLLNAVKGLIEALQTEYRPLVAVIDGLDLVKEQDTVRALFVDSTLLGQLNCASVVVGPILLRQSGLAARILHFDPLILANAPVIDRDHPRRPGPGVAFMHEVFQRRVADLAAPPGLASAASVLSPAQLERLAYYSGGHVREFIRMIRMAAELAWQRELTVVDDRTIHDCIDTRRRVLELGLNSETLALLTQVARNPADLPSDPEIVQLLDDLKLLPYPNESEWYFPHPLLTIRKIPLT